MFLITSDLDLIGDAPDNSSHNIHLYKSRPLKPSEAAEFVSHRISQFRCLTLPVLQTYNCFPFDIDNIRDAVEEVLLKSNGGSGPITIRQLNRILEEAVRSRLIELPDSYHIKQITEHNISNEFIYLKEFYSTLIN